MKSKSQPDSVVRRRSLRLASKSNDTPNPPTHDPETPSASTASVPVHNDEPLLPNVDRSSDSEEDVKTEEAGHSASKVDSDFEKRTGKRKYVDLSVSLTLRSGKKVSKGIVIGRNKGKVVQEDTDVAELVSHKGKGKLDSGNILLDNADDGERWKRRLTREEKGKGVMVEEEVKTHVFVDTELNEIFEDDTSDDVDTDIDNDMGVDIGDAVVENVGVEEEGRNETVNVNDAGNSYIIRFRNIARRNAVRFAHFNAETGEASIDGPFEPVRLSTTATVEAEDWPGPFSTAMKIIKDRANKGNVQLRGSAGMNACKDEPSLWVPKQSVETGRTKLSPPSLEDLSLDVLVKNVDAISSLTSVPDMMRHKLCEALSNSRKMNGNLFRLLLSGSPMEVRVRDSSWLTEEDFMEHFAGCDTSNLTVLQLDQCGRCMPDYVVHNTMARSSNKLPVLAALSLQAACRLSDSGLSAIASAAPRLQSINLSQCSLLTSAGIQSLTRSLGSILKELYIDDCQSIDIMECMISLKEVKCLEVLSVAGIESVCDDFIKELMIVHGQCLKELILTDCMNLTDNSLKAIAENSFCLCALNLVNISNLTDIGLGYLANGILKFKILKFCRNKFSDEALAAFVETCGDCLEELWLNSIIMVGRNTAVSLAKHSRKLITLDISWCRNLADDAVGLIVDSCDSLKILKIFGCTQLTDVFFNGHSNPNVQVIGRKMTPIIKHIKGPNPLQGPLLYSSVISV